MPADLESLTSRSRKVDLDGVDFDAFVRTPLDDASLRCLRYMHDVESHTACYLRDLLVTRAHRDATVTAFLACWVYEEHWHGEAIARVLAAHEEPAGTARIETLRAHLPRRDSLRPFAFGLASAMSRHIVAVHMAWGALNEWCTQAAYARLAKLSGHPVLAELLRRIMRQEGRHIDFYASEATRRLAGSKLAQRMTRAVISRFWAPVGSGVMPPEEVGFLVRHLFSGDDGLEVARRIDRSFGRLPGLEALGLVERSVERARGEAA